MIKPDLCLFIGLFVSNIAVSAQAQIAVDGTTNTILTPTDNGIRIDDGDRSGNNLFHSFQEFSVPDGSSASFNNAVEIENIFSRVTGRNISNINGLIQANGSANLFLINPGGIIFGENARLDIGGSFFATSADSLLFEEGEFSAVNPNAAPLLTINRPIGLNFGDNSGDIVNRSNFGLQITSIDIGLLPEFEVRDAIGLQVNNGETIALIGGDVILANAGGITASGGTLELGGLSQEGTITIDETNSLTFPEGVERGNVTLTGQSQVNVTGDGGGTINVNAQNLELSQRSELYAGIAEDGGSETSVAGDININATDSVTIIGEPDLSTGSSFEELIEAFTFSRDYGGGIRNNVGISSVRRNPDTIRSNGIGDGGDINITTGKLTLFDVAAIDTSVFGTGNGGDININADNVTLSGSQSVFLAQVRGFDFSRVREQGIGDGGNLNINTGSIALSDGSGILLDAQPGALGNAGDININAEGEVNFIYEGNPGFILTQLGGGSVGSAGDINIKGDSINLSNAQFIADASTDSEGNAGNIIFEAEDSLMLDNDTLILTQIQFGATGNGGFIDIDAGSISLDNLSLISSNAAVTSRGEAGNIKITGGRLEVKGGSAIDLLTENDFAGGDLSIETDSLALIDGGKLVASTDGRGKAGNINLTIAGDITIDNRNPPTENLFNEVILQDLNDEAGIFANTISDFTGAGGNIAIAANSVFLNNRSSISAATVSNAGGNVSLQLEGLLSLRNNSSISARSEGFGSGGNIAIDANFIFASPNQNNDIIANAERGSGGNIDITAENILGIQERNSNPPNNTNDFDVSSQLSIDGTITIDDPDVDPTSGIIELPSVPIDAERILAQDICKIENETVANGSSFIVTGRGGLTPTSANSLSNINRVVDWVDESDLDTSNNGAIAIRQSPDLGKTSHNNLSRNKTTPNFRQSQGFLVTADGSLWLTADAPQTIAESSAVVHPDCRNNS